MAADSSASHQSPPQPVGQQQRRTTADYFSFLHYIAQSTDGFYCLLKKITATAA